MKNTVDYIINWKKDINMLSVEDMHKSNEYVKNWEYRDVMYSFYGIYVIGLLVMYPEKFHNSGCRISLKDNESKDKLYNHVMESYNEYSKLNDMPELKNFIKVYDTVGNVIPVWPGANEHRGYKSMCYDLPDIYFKRHSKWTEHLIEMYSDAAIRQIHRSKYPIMMNDFLELMKKEGEYKKFLKYVVRKIKYRTKILSKKEGV